jgi:hypothetical protein
VRQDRSQENDSPRTVVSTCSITEFIAALNRLLLPDIFETTSTPVKWTISRIPLIHSHA